MLNPFQVGLEILQQCMVLLPLREISFEVAGQLDEIAAAAIAAFGPTLMANVGLNKNYTSFSPVERD